MNIKTIVQEIDNAQKTLREAGFFDYPTPWMFLTVKKIEKDLHYSDNSAWEEDNSAWEEWMTNQLENYDCDNDPEDCTCANCRMWKWWENMGITERAMLYGYMITCCRTTAEHMGWAAK